MTIDLKALTAVLAEHFPLRGPYVEMHLVAMEDEPEMLAREGVDGRIYITARLVEWMDEGSRRCIRNIKEQRVFFAHIQGEVDEARLLAYTQGCAMAMVRALDGTDVDMYMPSDFFFPRVLKLVRPRTAEDYAEALSVKSRLGRFMAPEET